MRDPEGTVEYTFVFVKENMAMCRGKILHAESDPNHLPPAYDETPKFAPNMEDGTTPIEHYVRRVVTYLARLQSVTQNTDYGLALMKVYVKMNIRGWLPMYSRLYHGCDWEPCDHLPTPVMLTIAALVNSEEDMRGNHNDEDVNMNTGNDVNAPDRHRENALKAAREMRRSLAVEVQMQLRCENRLHSWVPTSRCTSPTNRRHFHCPVRCKTKGWGNLATKFEPVDFAKSERVLEVLKEKIQALSEEQRSTVTVHIHLCLQAVVCENLAVPLHESSMDARSNLESILKRVYVQHIAAILKLVPRPPIVMINHDKCFFAYAHKTLRQRENFVGYDAVGAYLAGAWWFMAPPPGAR